MTAISKLSLEELYTEVKTKGRATPSVFARISALEDFSKPNERYCNNVCTVGCKNLSKAEPALGEEDGILVILDTPPKTARDEKTVSKIIDYLMRKMCPGIPYAISYSVRCKPAFEQKKAYTLTQSKACSNYLKADLARLKPRVVIVTSTLTAKSIGLMKFGLKSNLSRFTFQEDVAVVMTLSPLSTTMIRQNASGAFWGNDFFALIEHDFFKAGQLWRKEIGPQDPPAAVAALKESGRLAVTQSLSEVRAFCKFLLGLKDGTVISWDTETTGLDPWQPDARFLTHQFGFTRDGKVHAVVIPLWHRENKAYDANEAWPWVAQVLEAEHLKKVGHNGKFDLKYTRVVTGVEVKGYVFDTMYATHSICSGLQGAYSLKKATWDFVPELGLGGYDDYLDFDDEQEDEDADN